jgi:hypothetical protein
MFYRSVNDTSRAVRMMITGNTTTWVSLLLLTRGVIYDSNIFIIQVTGVNVIRKLSSSLTTRPNKLDHWSQATLSSRFLYL